MNRASKQTTSSSGADTKRTTIKRLLKRDAHWRYDIILGGVGGWLNHVTQGSSSKESIGMNNQARDYHTKD